MIEQTCKTNGDYLLNQYPNADRALSSLLKKYKNFKPSIMSCVKEPKNYINELMRVSQDSDSVKDKVSAIWFNKFLQYITKCSTKGMAVAKNFMNKTMSTNLSEGFFKSVIKDAFHIARKSIFTPLMWVMGLCLGIVSAIVIIAVGLWMRATGDIVVKLKSSPSLLTKIKEKLKKFFGETSDDLPDELEPPDLDIPNVNLSINVSESISSFMVDSAKVKTAQVCMKVLFLLCLKAVLSLYMNPYFSTAITLGVSVFTPGMDFISYLLVWLMIGVTAIIKFFKKPDVRYVNDSE
jgi:hypothetical protein